MIVYGTKDLKLNFEFLIGFSILTVIKTVNDSHLGNRKGQSVLCVMYCDGKID